METHVVLRNSLLTFWIFFATIAISASEEFFAPVYELGSYVPPIPPTGEIKPGKKPSLPIGSLEFGNRVGEGEEQQKPVVPPSFVLGSNTPISSIPVWTVRPIIPPGKPWPASEVGSGQIQTTTEKKVILQSVGDRFGEGNENKTVLDYKPMRPSFHPSPGNNIQQIIGPGKPWPAASSQPTTSSTNSNELEDRIGENKPSNSGFIWPQVDNVNPTQIPLGDRIGDEKENKTVLDYKPMRPSFHPNPGNNIQQIHGPGKPWPAGPTQTTQKPNSPSSPSLEDRFGEQKPASSGFFWPQVDDSNLELNSYPPLEDKFKDDGDDVERYPIGLNQKPMGTSYPTNPSFLEITHWLGKDWAEYKLVHDVKVEDLNRRAYANYYQFYVPYSYVPPVLVLDYKPNRPFYAGKPKE